MTTREAREFLSSYKHRKKALKILELKIQDLERQANGNGSMTISDTPGCSNGIRQEMKDIVARILDLKDRYWKEYLSNEKYCCDELERKILEVGKSNVLYGNVLSFYYIHGLTVSDIAEELNYCYDWTKRLLRKAIREFSLLNSKEAPAVPPIPMFK